MADLNVRVKMVTEGARNLSNLGRNLTIGVTAPLVAAGAAFINMAAEAEQSQAKMESVFESTGAAAWTSIDALNAHAEALAEATTFDDDAVKGAQAALLQFGTIAGEQFTGATEAAADLAAFMDTDITSAAETLGKALADPEAGMARLTRAGIILTDAQKEAVTAMVAAGDTAGAQQAILDAVSGRIGNVAEDLAATSGGQMAQAMNALGEAGEAIGTLLLPVLTGLAGVLKDVANWFRGLSPEMQGFIVTIAGVVAAVGPAIFIGTKLVGAFKAVGVAFNVLRVIMLANPFIALATAVAAIVTLIILNWDKIVAVFKGAMKFIGEVGEKLWTPISEGFGAAIDFIKAIWNAFARWWNSIEISVPSFEVPFIGTIGGFTIGLPDLPMLAKGGIVNQPTLALIGEGGPEAVVPLDRGMGMGTSISVTVLGHEQERLEEVIAGYIDRMLWTQGVTSGGS